METTTLQLFIRIASTGAIGKAGTEFGLSPTAATQRIKRLEHELGVRLFNRTTRTVTLTSDGEIFLVHARNMIANFEDALSDLSGSDTNIRGELRVTGSASFGRRYVAPYIGEFLAQYPSVKVRLDLSDSVVDIVEQGFDLALRIGTLESSSLIARKLADNPRLLVASPEYIERAGRPDTPADLAAHKCIVLAQNRNWTLRDARGIVTDVRVTGNFSTNYGDVVTKAALSGVGIALKSAWDIRESLADGSLVPVLEEYSIEPVWSLWAVRPPGQSMPARVRVFIDFIESKLLEIVG